MDNVPPVCDDQQTICYAVLDSSVRVTENCNHNIDGNRHDSQFYGLQVVHFSDNEGYYLFYCDENWNEITDTWHKSVEEAKLQAEFEFEGVSRLWTT